MRRLRSLRIVLDNNGSYAFKNGDELANSQPVVQYRKEHCATMLEIELNDELISDDINFYTLSFNMGSSLENRFDKKHIEHKITADSTPDYYADGVIYYQLPDTLTVFSSLCVQVEAHTVDETGVLISTVKSPAFEINFKRSVDGVPECIPGESNGFIAEFQKALSSMNKTIDEADSLFEKVNTAFENGELNGEAGKDATVNGFNAVEIKGSENIKVSQKDNVISIGVSNLLPVVKGLAQSAQEGATVLYCPDVNTVNITDGARTLNFDYSWIKNLTLGREDMCYFTLSVFVDEAEENAATFDIAADADGIYMLFYRDGVYEYQQTWVTDDSGEFIYSADDSCYSSYNELGEWIMNSLNEPVKSVVLPENIFSVDEQHENFTFTSMYLNPEICVYRGGKWNAVYDRN